MAVTLPPDAMAQLFAAVPANNLPVVPNYNVCPTNDVHIVTSDADGNRRLSAMRWGFLPHWYKKPNDGPLLINARAETIVEKPAFRAAAKSRRGIVIATGFYEWTKDADGGRDPWYIFPADGQPLAFAAIWQDWKDKEENRVTSCAVVTTAANDPMKVLHHRMPVILKPEDWALWLGEAGKGAATLMTSAPDDALSWYRVDRAVNSNRASGVQLTDPLET